MEDMTLNWKLVHTAQRIKDTHQQITALAHHPGRREEAVEEAVEVEVEGPSPSQVLEKARRVD